MKSKKLAALGLTAVLSLGLLTACSEAATTPTKPPPAARPRGRKWRSRRRQSR